MLLLELIVLMMAYLIGSLPVGYWLTKREGYHPREVSAYNLGVENVLRTLGPLPALLSAAADLLKGLLAVALAAAFERVDVGLLAGLAVYLGHLFPPRTFFPDLPPRGRGNLVLLGVLAGFHVALGLPLYLALIPLVVFGALLGYTGFVALATVTGLTALALLVTVTSVGWAGKLALWLLLAVAVYRFKENLGRILDRTENRLGEPVPMAGRREDQVVAAFMVHPLSEEDFWQTGRFGWLKTFVEAGILPMEWVRAFTEWLRPMKMGELRGVYTADGKEIRTYLISSPILPEVFRDKPDLAVKRAIEGAKLARELGASVFGLGAFWSTVGNKGQDVQDAVPEIVVTNGGAYTAGTIKAAIPAILEHFRQQGRDLSAATAAVVGANGVVAFGIARTIAPQVKKIILVGRDLERLERSKTTLQRANPNTELVASVNIEDIREADLIFTATSDPNPVIFKQHVKEGAWIFDEGRPADADLSVLEVPGVRLIPGGVVIPPGSMQARINLHFGEGAVPACLAETMILAATGEFDRRSLGPHTRTEDIAFFVERAEQLGFKTVE
ncbi:acyl-phosphate glycerol 3-phosphate acyltransferase [Deinobacterium chartae]|uniref:Glycerol-3-phosphate acyltransferase n=1 Tax=Deinobacterium chartae TaxID=521158 RepID=A0A841I6F4_9DEIO|nr:glycerol-3-phosphate acyltransferase [Deinobacterium chartae]MBB6099482.1 acyl-phosphate glycerol 3-phosphate acyltransferase [Deinobacterium chartae]